MDMITLFHRLLVIECGGAMPSFTVGDNVPR
jgi:hypothetical protein